MKFVQRLGLLVFALAMAGNAVQSQVAPPDRRFQSGTVLFADDFAHGLRAWRVEMEKPGNVTAQGGVLDIDVPAGATFWLRRRLRGPVMIQYEVTAVAEGGPNDRVSDLNCFWMATDPAAPNDIFARPRNGAFAEYNSLRTYYVGLGGNGNTTTRFRRYIGDAIERPLLPENDLSTAERPYAGIAANKPQVVTLIASGELIQFWRDRVKIFEMVDPEPYTSGWFGIRTTKNHMRVRNLRIVRLLPR